MTSSGQKESGSYKIFVGGLDPCTTEEDLTEYFSKFGKVVERLIKVDIKTKRSRGFAFIGFKSPDAVDKVLEVYEHILHGKKIDCKRAMTKEDAYSLNKTLKDSCRKVFISNIPKELTKKDLYDLFIGFGRINDFNLIFKKKETGFLYIIFDNEDDALNLIEKKYVEVNGFRLEIQKAIPKESKDNLEEESKGKAINSYQGNQMPKYRSSFESPFSYESYYPSTATSLMMGGQYPKHSPYNYYEVGPGHRLPESLSPYERPVMVPHAHGMPGSDPRFHANRIYPPTSAAFASPAESLGFDRVPQRSRVRSEQAINTLSSAFAQAPGPQFQFGNDPRVHPRSRMGGHSFSHVDDRGFLFNTLHETEAPALHAKPRPGGHEFIENKMDFTAFKPKDTTPLEHTKKETGSPGLKAEGNNRQAKQAKIKSLEEEIKATKEKLKNLEELLKQEYATVEEGLSNHEGQSQSSNNE